MSQAIQELIDLLARLPGIGPRSAARLVFHLINANQDYVSKLGDSISLFHQRIKKCSLCANITDQDPCNLCCDNRRLDSIICVVETIPDLWAIENGGYYRGRYHVLHGLLSPLDGIGPDDLNLDLLIKNVKEGQVEEIILATRTSIEGEATALMIKEQFKNNKLKITRIASGIPHGGELEYADKWTLERALSDRKAIL